MGVKIGEVGVISLSLTNDPIFWQKDWVSLLPLSSPLLSTCLQHLPPHQDPSPWPWVMEGAPGSKLNPFSSPHPPPHLLWSPAHCL
jgi:hypothetical protein